jgi:hypothetical protein
VLPPGPAVRTGEAPAAESVRTLMLVLGVLLLASFVAPWRLGGDATIFAWTMFESAPDTGTRVIPYLWVSSGFLAVALGAMKMTGLVRGIAAALIGLVPLAYVTLMPALDGDLWRPLAQAGGALLIVTGLVVRSRHPLHRARLMITVGVGLVLAAVLVPDAAGDLPLVEQLGSFAFSELSLATMGPAFDLLAIALALVALLAWLPGPARLLPLLLAWTILVLPFVRVLVPTLASDDLAAALGGTLVAWLHTPLGVLAWSALFAYGAAVFIADDVEAG